MNTPVWLGEYIYIYNFDAGEALQFPSLDGLVDYINDSKFDQMAQINFISTTLRYDKIRNRSFSIAVCN